MSHPPVQLMSSPKHQPGDQVNPKHPIQAQTRSSQVVRISMHMAYPFMKVPESSIPSAIALGNMKNIVAGCTSHLSTSQIVPARNQPFAMDNSPIFQSLGRQDARATGSSARLGVTARGIWHCTKLPGCSEEPKSCPCLNWIPQPSYFMLVK